MNYGLTEYTFNSISETTFINLHIDCNSKNVTYMIQCINHCNNHNATDMQLFPHELVESNRDSVRKAREAYLIERGQSLEPHGLNKKDET